MKRIILIAILSFAFVVNAQNQKDSVKVNAGFILAPQGGISLKNPKNLFSSFIPVFVVVPITIKNVTVTPFYTITNNSVGAAVEYTISPKLGMYVVGNKNMLSTSGYVGIGWDTPVFNGYGAGFVEVGSDFSVSDPFIYTGVFLPLTRRVRLN